MTACLAVQPDDLLAHHRRGLARLNLGDGTGAVEDLERALALAGSEERATVASDLDRARSTC